MAQSIGEVMTADPITVPSTATVVEAARAMRDADVGDVIVVDDRRLHGILTDRDIVVRVIAEGRQAAATTVGDICSRERATVSPNDDVGEALALMRDKALRRLPVVDGDHPVGMVSLGDLAVERDERSVLGAISAAPPNR